MMNGGLKFDIKKIDYSKTVQQAHSDAIKCITDFCEKSITEEIKNKEGVDMKHEIIKGNAKDFEGKDFDVLTKYRIVGHVTENYSNRPANKLLSCSLGHVVDIIAERRPITDESALNECITPAVDRITGFYAQELSERCLDTMVATKLAEESDAEDFVTFGKYDRQCKGVVIDVYDVLQAFEVVNPALQHLIKKALCAGLRGHKKREQDLVEILESAKRAIELEGK